MIYQYSIPAEKRKGGKEAKIELVPNPAAQAAKIPGTSHPGGLPPITNFSIPSRSCGAILANYQNAAERFMNCTSVYKEVSKDFLDNF